MIDLMYWISFMNFIYVVHLMCWNYLIVLITQNRNRSNGSNRKHRDIRNNKGGARPPFVVSDVPFFSVAPVASVSVLSDQDDQR